MKTKELLINSQPIAYRTIYNSFSNNKTSHAYLIEGQQGSPILETAYFLAKSFLCGEDVLACEECNTCRRIESGTYPDLMVIKPEGGKEISRDAVDNLQNSFSLTPIESKKKVYIIHQIDKVGNASLNRLLKFLEEPSEDIVAILTTQNIAKVLPTIISRCQLVRLVNTSKNLLMNELMSSYDLSDAFILSSFCNSKEEANEVTTKTNYHSIKDMAFETVRYCLEDNKHLLYHVMNQVEKFLKDKDEYDLFLDLIALYFKQLIVDPNGDLTYMLKNKTNLNLENALEKTLIAQHKITSYSNNGLVIDQLFNDIIAKEG